jgi:hypothetical protein
MIIDKPFSLLVDSLLPGYIKEEYPSYVAFIKRYFSAMEEDSGPVAVVNELTKYVDVSRVPEENINSLIYQYLNSFPLEDFDSINIRNFINYSTDFYSRKGTVNSLDFLFKMISGSLEVYYPADDIFHLNISNLSGAHAIHDNVYYAYYVYEIRSDQEIDKYQEMVENLVHPAGTKVFYVKI